MAHTDRQTDGHGDSMTDPAQRAESVKRLAQKVTYIGWDKLHFPNVYPPLWESVEEKEIRLLVFNFIPSKQLQHLLSANGQNKG